MEREPVIPGLASSRISPFDRRETSRAPGADLPVFRDVDATRFRQRRMLMHFLDVLFQVTPFNKRGASRTSNQSSPAGHFACLPLLEILLLKRNDGAIAALDAFDPMSQG